MSAPPDRDRPAPPPAGEPVRYIVLGEAQPGTPGAAIGGRAERFWQLFSQAVLGMIPLAFAGFFVLLVVHELRRGAVEITRVEVPAKLQEAGLTPEVVARRLVDALDRTGEAAQAETARRRVAQLAAMTPDFSVPVAGISMRSLAELVRDLLMLPKTEISGEITLVDEKLSIRLRLYRRGEVVSLAGFPPQQVDALLEAAAPGVWRVLQPEVYAWYVAGTVADQDEVIRLLAALAAEPDSDQATRDTAAYLSGQALLRAGRAEEALGLLQALARDRPGYAQGAFGTATALAALDRGEEALAAHADAVRRHGATAWTHLAAGRLLLELDRPGPALAEAEAGLQLDPALADLLLLRVAALAAARRDAEALREARAWRGRRPDVAAAHLAEGLALRAADPERLAESLAACRRAIALGIEAPGTMRGDALFRSEAMVCVAEALLASAAGDPASAAWVEALALLDSAGTTGQRVEPALAARALLLRAEALAAAERPEEALAAFDAALRLRPRRPATLQGRALVLEALDRPGDALRAWEHLVAVQGAADPAARAALARLGAASR